MDRCFEMIKNVVGIVFSLIGIYVAIIGLENYLKEIRGKYSFDLSLRIGKEINKFTGILKFIRADFVVLTSYEKLSSSDSRERIEYIKVRLDDLINEKVKELTESLKSIEVLTIEANVIWNGRKIINLLDRYTLIFMSFKMAFNQFKKKWLINDKTTKPIKITDSDLYKDKFLLNIFYLPVDSVLYISKEKTIQIDNKIEKDIESLNNEVYKFMKKYF